MHSRAILNGGIEKKRNVLALNWPVVAQISNWETTADLQVRYRAHREGLVSEESFSALLEDRPRHFEIKAVLDQKLKTDEEKCITRKGVFRVVREAERERERAVLGCVLGRSD